MDVESTAIPEVKLIKPEVHKDDRGYFFESYKINDFADHGLPTNFVQDNQARSEKGVLRGLHYQLENPQGKLVWVTEGKVIDAAVDIRKGSPTFGQAVTAVLDDESHYRFYVPPGFAHGYYVLTDFALFQYKCTDIYHPEDEYGIIWNDPNINISWGDGDKLISEKDTKLPNLMDINNVSLPKYEILT